MWLGDHFSLHFDYNLYCYSVGLGFFLKNVKTGNSRCVHIFMLKMRSEFSVGSSWVFLGCFFFPLLWLNCVFAQESQSWVSSGGCLSSRPCRSTSSCAVRTQQEAFWISLASQYHTIWAHTHYTFVQLYSCVAFLHHCPVLLSWYVQVQRFLPHVLLPQRPLHSTALWEHGQPLRGDPRQGGE